ncbi:MAG: ribose 5-phosphate isomerase B [Christensenellales bacterium]
MKIAIGTDHGGICLKQAVLDTLKYMNIEFVDFGTHCEKSCDYPDFALPVAEAVSKGEFDKGILLCGTGIGISIAANKVKGIRAAVVTNEFTARACAAHNNANIVCMGGRVITPEQAKLLVKVWLDTPFEEGRHTLRLKKIQDIENTYMK